jgi:predicted porin
MQKKLIALAVAGLLAAPAFAQSNVTLYGTLDYGYTSIGSSSTRHTAGGNTHGLKTRTALDSGVSKFNRIGFRGTEDLGNGLKAVFVLENGLSGDNQDVGMFNSINRQSYAGLAGNFGTVAFGRQYTPQHLYSAAVDPFGKNGLGALGNSLIQDVRLNNLGAYISPNWGGFSFVAGYTFNGLAQENNENNGDVRVWAFAPSFTWNKLFVGGNYHAAQAKRAHSDKPANATTKLHTVYEMYASYDFGFVKVGSLVGRRTTKRNYFNGGAARDWNRDAKLTQFMVGATFKITPNDKIMTSVTYANENKNADIRGAVDTEKRRLRQFAIGYEHALSKRTALYALGAFQSHSRGFKGCANSSADCAPVGFRSQAGVNGGAGVGTVGGNALGYDGFYRRGIGAGIRHDF